MQASVLRSSVVALALGLSAVACERVLTRSGDEASITSNLGASPLYSLRDVPATRLALPPVARPYDTDDAALEDALRARGGLAFVAFKAPSSARALEARGERGAVSAAVARQALDMLDRSEVEVVNVYGAAAIAYVRIPEGRAAAVRRSPLVDFVEPLQPVELTERPTPRPLAGGANGRLVSPAALSQTIPWNVSFVRAPAAWSYSTGVTAKIMLIGTGIIPQPDLPVLPPGNCGGLLNACDAWQMDGTALLGIVAALDNSIGVVGVAPGVPGWQVYAWRVFRDDGTVDANLYLSGFNEAILYGIKAVLVDVVHTNYIETLEATIAAGWAQGTIVVAPVGGTTGQYVSTIYPASHSHAVGVSGVRDDSLFATASNSGCSATYSAGSNWGPMVDLSAPFWAVTTIPGGYYDTRWLMGWCGTKFAAAHVAGIVALLQDRYPIYTAGQIVQRLTSTASRANYRDDYYGFGIPNAAAAMVEPPPPPPPPIFVSISGPSAVRPYAYCRWYGSASGGTEPYAFTWYIDGVPVGDGSATLSYSNFGNPFTITLSVTDANGRPGGNGLSAAIDPDTWECLDQ